MTKDVSHTLSDLLDELESSIEHSLSARSTAGAAMDLNAASSRSSQGA